MFEWKAVPLRKRVIRLGVLVVLAVAVGACGASGSETANPELAARGETMTSAKPTRQDLSNRVSLAGKVTMNPVFGLAAPVAGRVRYRDVQPAESTPTAPTRVASVWARGTAHPVRVPAGATFAGRLVDDRSTVTAGMPIVSAKLAGYGIVAEIDGEQAYRISDSLASVQAQIKSGPGPFACKALGTIAALPAGTIPDPPTPEPTATPEPGKQPPPPVQAPEEERGPEPSEATGMRLVCTAPAGVRLINGASATLEVVTEKAVNALVVPVEAVAGTQGRGKVDVVKADRSRETRDVALGLTDGKVVQIKSGLAENETVAIPGPNLPPAEPGTGEPGAEGP